MSKQYTLKQLKEEAYLDSPRDFYSWLLSPDGLDCIDGDALYLYQSKFYFFLKKFLLNIPFL